MSQNGKVRRDPETPVDPEHDLITIDGNRLKPEQKIYLMMHKPRGLVTTASDEKGRETVYSILQLSGESLPWVAPIGRLDKASEGLLLLTNDSEWGARIADPESHLEKTYHVRIGSIANDELLKRVRRGIKTQEGDILAASHCHLLRSGEKNCWLEIVLDEGKNRQIRRMFEALGIEVLRLLRVAIGPLQLGTLAKRTYRQLTNEEKYALDGALAAHANASAQQKQPRRLKVYAR